MLRDEALLLDTLLAARMVGMRHRLIHDDNQVRLDLVWDVACNRLPELVAAVEPLVPLPDEQD